MKQHEHSKSNVTEAGTAIDKVKRQNDDSGMSYNEAMEYIARTTGGQDTQFLSNTDVETVRQQIQRSEEH
ncbi:hypothetical protein [Tuberibacillus sp. Marseille-P3662]|uniref:hypothetical protein n=1 Tax=Tuberibacillus sp. Marseille-P3662 TaxID=1965358 RepID=UPI000A1CAC1D|nr:hypothetical protein [Tuberibacillus sp. Marseille-P3662]